MSHIPCYGTAATAPAPRAIVADMTWWQTLLIAVVPALVTAGSLILQQALARKADLVARREEWAHERDQRHYDELLEAHRSIRSALVGLSTDVQVWAAKTTFGLDDDEPLEPSEDLSLDSDTLSTVNLGIAAVMLSGGTTSATAAKVALDAIIGAGAAINDGGHTKFELFELTTRAAAALLDYTREAQADLGIMPPAPAGAAAQPRRRGPLARLTDQGQTGSHG